MRRLLPLFLWIALPSGALCGYPSYLIVSNSSGPSALAVRHFQDHTVTGKVTDDSGVGMPGVNVLLQGTSNGTTTDAEGSYRLNLSGDEACILFYRLRQPGDPDQQPECHQCYNGLRRTITDGSGGSGLWNTGETGCNRGHFTNKRRRHHENSHW